MEVKLIKYERIFPIAQYENVKVGLEATQSIGETEKQVLIQCDAIAKDFAVGVKAERDKENEIKKSFKDGGN